MAHIADLYNNGRVALHQTIDQARGAYFQLIGKEERAAQASFVRQQLALADVRCPACGVKVVTTKCHLCSYYPVPIPNGLLDSRRPPSSSSCGSIASSAGRMTRASSVAARATDERLEKLESMIREEQAQQKEVLNQIAAVRTLLERELLATPSATAGAAEEPAKGAAAASRVRLPSAAPAKTSSSAAIRQRPASTSAIARRPVNTTSKPPLAAKGYPQHNKLPTL